MESYRFKGALHTKPLIFRSGLDTISFLSLGRFIDFQLIWPVVAEMIMNIRVPIFIYAHLGAEDALL